MSNNAKKIEAILFMSGGPVSKKKIGILVGCDPDGVERYTEELFNARLESGVIIVDSGTHLSLATHPEVLSMVEKIEKEYVTGPLSKSAQETLSIISYAGPISKTDIDFLRGVNTQYAIRRLTTRGLVFEKKEGKNKFLVCTPEFLMHLGINKLKDLPNYADIRKTILESIVSTKKRMEESSI